MALMTRLRHRNEVIDLLFDYIETKWCFYDSKIALVSRLLPKWISKLISLIFTHHIVYDLTYEISSCPLTATKASIKSRRLPVLIFMLKLFQMCVIFKHSVTRWVDLHLATATLDKVFLSAFTFLPEFETSDAVNFHFSLLFTFLTE